MDPCSWVYYSEWLLRYSKFLYVLEKRICSQWTSCIQLVHRSSYVFWVMAGSCQHLEDSFNWAMLDRYIGNSMLSSIAINQNVSECLQSTFGRGYIRLDEAHLWLMTARGHCMTLTQHLKHLSNPWRYQKCFPPWTRGPIFLGCFYSYHH